MKIKLCVLIFMVLATLAQAQTNDLTSLLQQGLLEEQANRNLDAAIADYQSLALQFDKNRQIAATAIFRLGECYRMQGQTNQAAAQYQRILSDFSDQSTLATMSRQNLTGMGMTATPKGILPDTTASSENQDVALWNKLKGLPESDVKKILPTLVPDSALTILLQRYDETEALLAQMQVSYGPSHPKVLEQKVLLDVLNKQINDRVSGILDGLKMRAEIAQAGITTGISAANNSTDAEDQEIQRIQTMIQNSPDLINAANGDGKTPLQKAADNGWQRVAAFLLDHGADVNANDGGALFAAASAGNRAMVQFLLSRSADVNSRSANGKMPLHIAAEKNFQAVVETLLANKADVNVLDNFRDTPLILAVKGGNTKIVSLLLEHQAGANAVDNATPLSGGFGLPGGISGRTALSYAAGYSSPEIVKILLNAKADPNLGGFDLPLFEAINNNDAASAELLLQAGANPNVSGVVDVNVEIGGMIYMGRAITPLFFAISLKELPLVQLLLKYKADPNDTQTDRQPLLFSVLPETNILAALLDAGANVDARADSGFSSPVGKAASRNNPAAVEILLKHGADVNLTTSDGRTPLFYAISDLAGTNVFELLLDHGANPNVRYSGVQTPLDHLKEIARSDASLARRTLAAQLADLLRQHGALDKLPEWDQIIVSRPSANASRTVFTKGINDWNRFTLLETIFNFYKDYSESSYPVPGLFFPDLANLTVIRPNHDSTNETQIKINLLNNTNGIDCTKDIPLQFGDLVEIPEYTHALADKHIGLTGEQRKMIYTYLIGKAELISQGQKTEIPLSAFDGDIFISRVLNLPDAQKILQSSSDLSRVKVTRRDPQTGKIQTWIVDCSNSNNPPDLRVRNGDLIDVPTKQ